MTEGSQTLEITEALVQKVARALATQQRYAYEPGEELWDGQARAALEAALAPSVSPNDYRRGWEAASAACAEIARGMTSGPVWWVDGCPHARAVTGGDLIADEIIRRHLGTQLFTNI